MSASSVSEYPIYPKTYDLVHWLMQCTQSFPKSQRFVMAKRVQDTVLDFYELLIEARKVNLRQRRQVLLQADVKLETLRLTLRLCREMNLITPNQYKHVSLLVAEVGRLLGNWRNGSSSGSEGK